MRQPNQDEGRERDSDGSKGCTYIMYSTHENNLIFQALSVLIMARKRPGKNSRLSMRLKVSTMMMRVSQER